MEAIVAGGAFVGLFSLWVLLPKDAAEEVSVLPQFSLFNQRCSVEQPRGRETSPAVSGFSLSLAVRRGCNKKLTNW